MSSPTTIDTRTPPTSAARTPIGHRPGPIGYWLGALVAVLATLGALAWGTVAFLGWQTHVQEFPRLAFGGSMTVSVPDSGTRVIYLEHDRSIPVPPTPAVSVTGPSGAEVPLSAYRAELRYDVPGEANRIGEAVLTFQADEPGTYQVTVADTDPATTVAVGDNLVSGWAPQVVGSVALLLGGLLLALVIVIVTAARRARTTALTVPTQVLRPAPRRWQRTATAPWTPCQ